MLQDGCIAKTVKLKNRFSFDHEWTIIFCEFVLETLLYSKLNISNSRSEDYANNSGYRTQKYAILFKVQTQYLPCNASIYDKQYDN
jgi:hypothetical protein